MIRKQKGFTLVELLVVVAIIGILAAIAIPNLLGALQKSRQKRTLADMRTIATAWEARATDTGSYAAAGVAVEPPTDAIQPGETIAEIPGTPVSEQLVSWLQPTYVKQLPVYDGWGGEFRIGFLNNEYAIISSGADKTVQPDTWTAGPTHAYDCDIIILGGQFVMYPEGVQSKDATPEATPQPVT